jgi:hypothetical protein
VDKSAGGAVIRCLVLVFGLFFFPASSFGQLPSSRCNSEDISELQCTSNLSANQSEPAHTDPISSSSSINPDLRAELAVTPQAIVRDLMIPGPQLGVGNSDDAQPPRKEGLQWRPALEESFTFLVIEQAYVVHTDFNWVVSENGIPLNHFWRDYKQSLTSWNHAGWSAGEDPLYNYVGHPIQGALTGYIEAQNDPRYEKVEFSKTKAYWISRIRATLWNGVYSTQWSIGPLSEMTVEKYGAKDRPPWNSDGSWPCNTNKCYSGVGKVNLVMTPVGGLGWMLAEDILDKEIAERLEAHTHSRFLINTVRCVLNPIRGGALILHGEHPWYRASRDPQDAGLFSGLRSSPTAVETPNAHLVDRGNLFIGYTRAAATHCQGIYSGEVTPCDPFSAKTSDLNGWDVSAEKMYLRYFGAVAEFSGLYGDASQTNSLFGLRGGASIKGIRPFAQAMIGAVHAHESGSALAAETAFAEDLGLGVDLRMTRRLGWRTQVDELKSGSPSFERRNTRLTSGLVIRF